MKRILIASTISGLLFTIAAAASQLNSAPPMSLSVPTIDGTWQFT